MLSGPLADQPILAATASQNGQPSANAAPLAPSPKATSTSKKSAKGTGKKSVKKKLKGKPAGKNKTKGTPGRKTKKPGTPVATTTNTPRQSVPATQQEVPGTMGNAEPVPTGEPPRRVAAKKCAAKKPATPQQRNVQPELPPCKLEKREKPTVKLPATPPSVRENRARNAAISGAVGRANTSDQIGNVTMQTVEEVLAAVGPVPVGPGPTAPEEDEYYDPSENSDYEEDNEDAEAEEGEDDQESGETSNQATPTTTTTTRGKKKNKEKTPQQKAAHARYMKFFRNVRSIPAAILNWSCSSAMPSWIAVTTWLVFILQCIGVAQCNNGTRLIMM